MGLPKAYETEARLGWTSSTGDPEGELVRTGRVPPADVPLPTGRVRQRPPAYSAIKLGGVRAYTRARRGEVVDVPEREVLVTRFEQRWRREERAAFAIECSSGTYVRSLVMALGDAYCEELRRTAIGPFAVEDADPERALPLGEALARVMPVVALAGDDARRAGHGVAVPAAAAGTVLLVGEDGPIAVAEPREGGLVKPVVGFRA
jgi:tRNA pseudouridine55 synthase